MGPEGAQKTQTWQYMRVPVGEHRLEASPPGVSIGKDSPPAIPPTKALATTRDDDHPVIQNAPSEACVSHDKESTDLKASSECCKLKKKKRHEREEHDPKARKRVRTSSHTFATCPTPGKSARRLCKKYTYQHFCRTPSCMVRE